MNKLNTFTGGHPFNIDDLVFLYATIKDTFKGLAYAFGNKYIVCGCEITRTDLGNGTESISVTDGYIFVADEIIKVNARTSTHATTAVKYFEIRTAYDSQGVKRYADNNTRNCFEIRYAEITDAPAAPIGSLTLDIDYRLYYQIPRLYELIEALQTNMGNYYSKSDSEARYAYKVHSHSQFSDFYTKIEADNLLDDKSDKATTYSSIQVNNLLDDKSDKATTYSSIQVNNLLDGKSDIGHSHASVPTLSTTNSQPIHKDYEPDHTWSGDVIIDRFGSVVTININVALYYSQVVSFTLPAWAKNKGLARRYARGYGQNGSEGYIQVEGQNLIIEANNSGTISDIITFITDTENV
jgi:hypothetical protein